MVGEMGKVLVEDGGPWDVYGCSGRLCLAPAGVGRGPSLGRLLCSYLVREGSERGCGPAGATNMQSLAARDGYIRQPVETEVRRCDTCCDLIESVRVVEVVAEMQRGPTYM